MHAAAEAPQQCAEYRRQGHEGMAGLKGWALPQLDLPADHGQVGQRQHGQHQQHGHDLSAAAGPDGAGDEEPGDFHQDEEHGQQVHVDGQGGQ